MKIAASSIGLITGMPQELAALTSISDQSETIKQGSREFLRLSIGPKTLYACCSGIGKVNAASATEALIQHFQVELLSVIGTAGSISALEPGAYLLNESIQSDYGSWHQRAFLHFPAGSIPVGTPTVEPFVSPLADAIIAADPGIPHARIATADSFISDAAHAATIARNLDAQLVDMETAALAQVAQRHETDWLAVKAISDNANDDSAGDFARQLAEASAAAARLYAALIC